MLSRVAVGTGLLWFVLLCATAWIWGQWAAGGHDALFGTALSALALVCVAWGAVLAREGRGRGRWILGAVALGAFVGALLVTASESTTDLYSSDGPYPQIAFLVIAVFLAVPIGAGVAVGHLLRSTARK